MSIRVPRAGHVPQEHREPIPVFGSRSRSALDPVPLAEGRSVTRLHANNAEIFAQSTDFIRPTQSVSRSLKTRGKGSIGSHMGGPVVKSRVFRGLLLISMIGCQSTKTSHCTHLTITRPSRDVQRPRSDSPQLLAHFYGNLIGPTCAVRQLQPGAKCVDYEHGGGWVQVESDGKVRPIPAPQENTPPEPSPAPP